MTGAISGNEESICFCGCLYHDHFTRARNKPCSKCDCSKYHTTRANDPAIKAVLLHMRQINIQNPEYSVIKKLLEEGIDGRYKSNDGAIKAKTIFTVPPHVGENVEVPKYCKVTYYDPEEREAI